MAAVPRSLLRDAAYQRLREAIITGALAPGQTVVIDDLARQLELSTMPIREALAAVAAVHGTWAAFADELLQLRDDHIKA